MNSNTRLHEPAPHPAKRIQLPRAAQVTKPIQLSFAVVPRNKAHSRRARENSLIATNARCSTPVALSWTTIVMGYATHSCLVDRLLAPTSNLALTIVIGYSTNSCLVDRFAQVA